MPIELKLRDGQISIIDEDDYPKLIGYNWLLNSYGYVCRKTHLKAIFLHRLIMNAPDNLEVDHINGNILDNRKENLRLCTHAENMRNRKINKNNSSGYKGVTWYPTYSKWNSKIKFNSKNYNLGCFDDAIDAARAYDIKARELFGEFANTNF